jgi:protein-L-isoaspartate(D-aspartate) O-methyltransferase
MSDFSTRRVMMVDTQVRPSDVTKFPIIAAMLAVHRENFVPDAQREAAYAGQNIQFGNRRVVLEARSLAKLLDTLDIQPGEHVLDLGAGYGYASAVMSALGAVVVAVEDDADRAATAQSRLGAAGCDDVVVVHSPLQVGAPANGPFDVIIVQGAVEKMPETILAQVKEGGRIGALFMEGVLGTARIGRKQDGVVTWRYAFNASAPILPGFEAAREFIL